ncbi:hypothetical protein GO988_10915 [Hymenobacter sp. HMF4947]|uniref:DUF5103 domain-containing protein n=1 Tax=Hymenobacter ginkgonis TaxID=2682976 RepID=A0A7K1TEL7_9BACT|nr:hypothetical protein [Hymenobacter ginkgonis]MVN76834.1 hypothetical protein [Hymenobacter ginkgonis]
MKNLLLTLVMAALSLTSFGQKIAAKKNLITVDKQPYASIEYDGVDTYYVSSPQNERLFVVKWLYFNDPAAASATNAGGATSYLQFIFPGSHTLVETATPAPSFTAFPLILARQIYTARLLKNGALDSQAVADFASINGLLYSARRQALDRPIVVPVGSGY